ncbi:DUF6328 family protein [Cellulosimicrobium arenosum]|uniref:Sodium:proton antiporter n=1 Tax=Cellulosimicrobium arenosum TaxID=2708133 RepID=A0A927IZS8_9MICO|nr:DUF6328 family protein [Cellulosimicrobium arenosum]MBD8078713.1 sodium:proton antiporter [Cellulosimicrobium arenosum]
MDDQREDVGADTDRDARDETPAERSDRNWAELLQELRVMQMGVQILTGFLLTLPFQQRFADLDGFQTGVYLALVALAVLSTGLFITPVSLHRALFRQHRKRSLVTLGDRITRIGILVMAFVVTGTVLLIVDVVVSRSTAVWCAGIALVALVGLWFVLPRLVLRSR